MPKIKHCPLCGSETIIVVEFDDRDNDSVNQVDCDGCGNTSFVTIPIESSDESDEEGDPLTEPIMVSKTSLPLLSTVIADLFKEAQSEE